LGRRAAGGGARSHRGRRSERARARDSQAPSLDCDSPSVAATRPNGRRAAQIRRERLCRRQCRLQGHVAPARRADVYVQSAGSRRGHVRTGDRAPARWCAQAARRGPPHNQQDYRNHEPWSAALAQAAGPRAPAAAGAPPHRARIPCASSTPPPSERPSPRSPTTPRSPRPAGGAASRRSSEARKPSLISPIEPRASRCFRVPSRADA
jgi:hypothetical protein